MALPMRSRLARSSGSLMVAAMDRSSWAGISPPFMELLMVWSRLMVLCTDIVHRFSRQLLDCFPCLSLQKIYAYLTSSGSCPPLGTVFACHAFSLGIGGQYHLISTVSSITKSFIAH